MSFESVQQWVEAMTVHAVIGPVLARDIAVTWAGLQVALIGVAIIIFVSSTEDAVLDLSYWILMLGAPLTIWRRPSSAKIRALEERQVAIIVPAWQESGVIGQMLHNTVKSMEYKRYHVFVGVYPNDPKTRDEVETLSAAFPNIHCVIVDNPGPTKKSDCLNQVVRNILKYEAGSGEQFDIFVNHDAEDVVHPFELKLVNWYTRTNGMVQIPVFSLDRNPRALVACHYMDEFAEWHTKDLVIRSALTGMTPSAGVGTAFSRAAIDALLKARNNEIFNPNSLTEDYDIAQFLFHLGFKSQFIRYRARMPYKLATTFRKRVVLRYRREMVATREYFPDRFRAAIRQKARWMQGICFQGWRQIGWQGRTIDRYFLWRDRKQLLTAPAVILAYLIFFMAAALLIAPHIWRGFPVLPPLIERDWVWTLIYINLGYLVNRLLHRALFVWTAHGLRFVLLSPVRAVVGNFIGFFAFARALRQYIFSGLTGRSVAWDKTTHAFPVLALNAALVRVAGPHQAHAFSAGVRPRVGPREARDLRLLQELRTNARFVPPETSGLNPAGTKAP